MLHQQTWKGMRYDLQAGIVSMGVCCPTIARHSTSLKRLTINLASLVAVFFLNKRTAKASRRVQWFIIAAPSRRRISRLDHTSMCENQLVNGMLLKDEPELELGLTQITATFLDGREAFGQISTRSPRAGQMRLSPSARFRCQVQVQHDLHSRNP